MAQPTNGPGPLVPGDENSSGADDEASTNLKPSEAVRDLETHHGINEKALLRRIDMKLLPTVGILYLLSFLDRSNGGRHLSRFFVGYVLFEVPCNIILKRTTPRFWLPTLTIAFGIVATLLGVVTNLASFFVVRFLLGVAESGLFPGVVFYFSMWYTRKEVLTRVSLFFSAASLAGAFGGVLAYGIGRMRGVVWANSWRWIFILEGIVTVLVGVVAYWFIQNYPDTATFITEEERKFIRAKLAAHSDATNHEEFNWAGVKEALKDVKCWLYGLAFHSMSLPLYTLSLFFPTIIRDMGYSAWQAQLLTVPPYSFAFITTLSIALLSQKTGKRAVFIGGSATFAMIGYAILLANTDPKSRPGLSYAGTFFAAGGIYPATALVLSWPAINVSGQTKRAVANAMQISIGNCGAILGTQLYRANDGPRYIVGHSFALGYLVFNLVVCTTLWYVLRGENKKRAALTEEVKAVGDVRDWPGDSDPRWRFEH
ncbi:major facilitator superfamily domain-containing protein [Plectosphaerella plurivora]|uniref:Major facilitator superfamily domain-containing protein n=1 Tax=Plectosphaerella plurivora TaxID=936078 RepID=A0A9P8VPL9_9PEZI|nr:major facilitator superfamily domain-containing protein [Plectosphaerella plurivora]